METDQLQSVFGQWPSDSSCVWMNEWMNEHLQGGGEKEMHVRPTMLASHDKLWISLFFGVERCETVFIIIMKIIMMIIIMMVIKGKKNLTTNVTLLPHTLTLLNSCTLSPWHWMEECWHLLSVLVQGSASKWCQDFQCPGTKAPPPARGWCP